MPEPPVCSYMRVEPVSFPVWPEDRHEVRSWSTSSAEYGRAVWSKPLQPDCRRAADHAPRHSARCSAALVVVAARRGDVIRAALCIGRLIAIACVARDDAHVAIHESLVLQVAYDALGFVVAVE